MTATAPRVVALVALSALVASTSAFIAPVSPGAGRSRARAASMCAEPTPVDVSQAAAEAEALLDSQLSSIYAEDYLTQRDSLVGSLSSSELLKRDEAAGMYPNTLDADPEAKSMLWVDELSCVGCKFCASVARCTFKMAEEDHDYGTARVVQQGGDLDDVVEEAIDCCPVDAIHRLTRPELEVLETHRDLYMDDLLARWKTRALVSQGEGGGALAAPHWRDPLVHTGWMKGEK